VSRERDPAGGEAMKMRGTTKGTIFDRVLTLAYFLSDPIPLVHGTVNVDKGNFDHHSFFSLIVAVPLPTTVILIVIHLPLSLLIQKLEIDQALPNHFLRNHQKEKKYHPAFSKSFLSLIGVAQMNV
jgi:hypothetical protein